MDAALVLKLGKLGSALLVHNLLQVAAHRAVALANLSKDVGLVTLLGDTGLDHLLLISAVLALNLTLHVLTLVVSHPITLLLLALVNLNCLLAGLVHILKQVDASLVFAVPLFFALLPLLLVLFRDEVVNHLFVRLLIRSCLSSVLLKLNGLCSVLIALLFLKLLNGSLAGKTLVKELNVTLFFGKLSLLAEHLFLFIMLNEVLVALQVQNVLFVLSSLLAFLLVLPLFSEHLTFLLSPLFILTFLDITSLLLPIQNSKGVFDKSLLFLCLS